MLFNSYNFIFLFLVPLLVVARYLHPKYIFGYLILVSIVFYAQWDLLHLSLLTVSIITNYFLSKQLTLKYKKPILFLAITLNLIPLLFFKYSYFLSLSTHTYTLPLAISFYTFQQIAFLVDVYHVKIKNTTLKEYLFFVLFFPHLIAGPILHYNELIPQAKKITILLENILIGTVVFTVGLAKKVLLADSLSPIANLGFSQIQTTTLSSADAWIALFAYSFEIYFDFSAYSDMAVGLALMFGILLPVNFNSPYKAANLIDFWRRWHITLSTFLKEHVYIPLGGNKKGQFLNIFITMFIGGIWHGSGWGFLLWGSLHGLILGFLHLRNSLLPQTPDMFKPLTIFITFLTVTLLWVFFRAPSLEIALKYYNVLFSLSLHDFTTIQQLLQKELYENLFTDNRLFILTLAFIIIWLAPFNSNYFYNKKPTKIILFISAILFMTSLKTLASTPANSFLYFNF
ncbi:MAG: MBOAT family protein [Campylobacterales bacterium]|nr:MBOAT family protein [Campylobacterales bacterium]